MQGSQIHGDPWGYSLASLTSPWPSWPSLRLLEKPKNHLKKLKILKHLENLENKKDKKPKPPNLPLALLALLPVLPRIPGVHELAFEKPCLAGTLLKASNQELLGTKQRFWDPFEPWRHPFLHICRKTLFYMHLRYVRNPPSTQKGLRSHLQKKLKGIM